MRRVAHSLVALALIAVGISHAVITVVAEDLPPFPDPFHTVQLDDDTFESVTFPEGTPIAEQRPYLIMFYSPTCGHCRQMLPVFNNASIQLYNDPLHPEWSKETARLAVVDAIKNTRLAGLYKVKSFPTFYYTLNGRAFRYFGAQTLPAFTHAAIALYKGFADRTFASSVTKVADFKAAMSAEVPRRPWFVLCRPSRPVAEGLQDAANTFVEASLTLGKPRFVQIYEDEAPTFSQRPDVMDDPAVKAYWAVRDACADGHAMKKDSLGPNGEVLLLWSDRTPRPLIYGGPSWAGNEETGVSPHIVSAGSSTFRPSRQLAMWVWENGYNGVEKLSPEVLSILAKRSRLGVFVLDGDTDFTLDTRFIPAINSLAQRRFNGYLEQHAFADSGIVSHYLQAQGMPIADDFDKSGQAVRMWLRTPTQFLIVDGKRYREWLEGLGVGDDKAPHFFVLDAMKETIWRLDEWAPKGQKGLLSNARQLEENGEELKLVSKFLDEVEGTKGAKGVKGSAMTSYGRVVHFIVDWVPFAGYLMSAVGDDDLKFVIFIIAVLGWSMVFAVSMRRQADGDEAGSPLLDRKFV